MVEQRTCALPGCNESFTPTRGNQKYHSHDCARQAEVLAKRGPPLEDRTCPYCGDVFVPVQANQVYCCAQHRRATEIKRKRRNVHTVTGAPAATCLSIPTAPEGTKVLLWGCIHIPFHDQRTLAAIERFVRDFRPDIAIYMGDTLDCFELSKFSKSPLKRSTWADDLRGGKAILANHRRLMKDARLIWIDGNHEYRLWLYSITKAPVFADVVDPPTLFGLRDLDIEYLPFGSHVNLLGLQVEHGCFARKFSGYSARAERERHGTSGCSVHTHRRGMHCWTDERGPHTWHELGCIARLDPDWLPHADWQHGFGYGIVHRNKVHVISVGVHSGGLRAEGKFYER